MWFIVVLARHSVCNLLSEIDSASAALLQVWCANFALLSPLCRSGGIAQAAASVFCGIL